MAEITIETRYDVYQPTQFPVRIGRAVDNDVVIRALGVADYHVMIEQNHAGLQVRNLHEAHLNGKPIRSRAVVDKNSFLTLGSAKIKLWLNPKGRMPNPATSAKWQCLTHPVAVAFWFIVALILPLWSDYLATATRYVVNWKLLFLTTIFILTLVWVIHSMVLPITRRYLLIPLLGITSAVSVFSEVLDVLIKRIGFQIDWVGIDLVEPVISSVLFILCIRAFMRDFIPMSGRLLTRYALAISLPCILLAVFNHLQAHGFYSQRPGSYPSYNHALYQSPLLGARYESVNEFLEIDKINQN